MQTKNTILPQILSFIFFGLLVFGQPCRAEQSGDIPLAARIVLAKAGALISEKAYDQAIEALKTFQARGAGQAADDASDPKGYRHVEVYFALGTCYLMKNSYKEAAEAFDLALKRDATHVAAWLNRAKTAHETNDYPLAALCFSKAYGHSTEKKPEYLYYCAAAHLMAQQNEPSLAAFDRLFKAHPEAIQPPWRENFVHALLTAGRAKQALPHIKVLAEHYSDEKQIQWQEILLHQYMQLDMRDQARDYALRLTRQAPTRAKWWKALAHVYLQENRHAPALTALTIYSYLEPLSAQELKLLADLHLQLGIPVKAAPLYDAALERGNDPRLLHNLMLALQQLGRPQQALDALDRLSPHSRDSDLLMLKADLLYGLERFKEAGDTYRDIAGIDSAKSALTGRAWLMAGYAALQLNDVETCRMAFKQAAAFEGQRKAALLAMRRLPGPSGKRSSL